MTVENHHHMGEATQATSKKAGRIYADRDKAPRFAQRATCWGCGRTAEADNLTWFYEHGSHRCAYLCDDCVPEDSEPRERLLAAGFYDAQIYSRGYQQEAERLRAERDKEEARRRWEQQEREEKERPWHRAYKGGFTSDEERDAFIAELESLFPKRKWRKGEMPNGQPIVIEVYEHTRNGNPPIFYAPEGYETDRQLREYGRVWIEPNTRTLRRIERALAQYSAARDQEILKAIDGILQIMGLHIVVTGFREYKVHLLPEWAGW